MEGSIRILQQEEKTLIKLEGLLDKELATNLIGTANKIAPPVILDLKQVPHLTVAGSQSILHFYQLHQQKPELRGANPDVISLLKLTGANHYITLLPTVSDTPTSNSVQE